MPDELIKPSPLETDLCIVGGGAAAFFCALTATQYAPGLRVIILEQGKQVLSKVRISGGGRCNVTHAFTDVRQFVRNYPRGSKELVGPFHRFGPTDTMSWFEQRSVPLKVEEDGRVFPVSDSSESIISCFLNHAKKRDIRILTSTKVRNFDLPEDTSTSFHVYTETHLIRSKFLFLATGSAPFVWNLLEKHGYVIVPPVPSLFTFNIPGHPLCALMGVAVQDAIIRIPEAKIQTTGPLLITHWGLSGPAVLRASAEGARWLADQQYNATVTIQWVAGLEADDIRAMRQEHPRKKVSGHSPVPLPQRLWKFLCSLSFSDQEKNWASLSRQEMEAIVTHLLHFRCTMTGKTTFKEEFVTAGGVGLGQIDFRTFESKQHKHLYMAGEILDIDAVTGGFNFQAAWTGGYIAGCDIAQTWSDKE